MAYSFKNGHIYTFDTKAPAVLGANFKNATHLGTVGYEIAQGRENIFLKYRQVYPVLPQGTVDDPQKQDYHLFRTESGQIIILCDQWINHDTIIEVRSIDFTIKFQNSTIQDMNNIRDILLASGYTNFTII